MADPHSSEVPPRREPPAFNVPGPVLVLLVLLFGVQIVAMSLSLEQQEQIVLLFSLIPARYISDVAALQAAYPGGIGADFWTLITYTFLHGGWEHLIVNSVWLLAFGSPVARRLGATRFFFFYFLCGIAGALLHVAIYAGSEIPVVGASAAISGLMGGAARFVFLADGPLGALGGRAINRPWGGGARRAGILTALRDRRTLIFVGVWIGLNFLFGATALSGVFGAAQVAWEAHLGGFLFGLLVFGLFDPLQLSPSGGPGNVGYGEWLGDQGPENRGE